MFKQVVSNCSIPLRFHGNNRTSVFNKKGLVASSGHFLPMGLMFVSLFTFAVVGVEVSGERSLSSTEPCCCSNFIHLCLCAVLVYGAIF